MTHRKILLCLWSLLFTCAWSTSLLAETITAQPKLEFKEPQAGKTYEGRLYQASIFVRNLQNKRYKARVECFGVVHHFALKPHLYKNEYRTNVNDRWMPYCTGSHTLTVSIVPYDAPQSPVCKDQISFHIAPKDPNAHYLNTALTSYNPTNPAETLYRSLMKLSSTDGLTEQIRAHQADQVHYARSMHGIQTILGLTRIATLYHEALDKERALGALEIAANFYEQDFAHLTQHPLKGAIPPLVHPDRGFLNLSPVEFMEDMADLYATYAHLDEAVKWSQRKRDYHDQERKSKTLSAGARRTATYRMSHEVSRIGMFKLLLADNTQAWEQSQVLSDKLQKEAKAMVVPGD